MFSDAAVDALADAPDLTDPMENGVGPLIKAEDADAITQAIADSGIGL